MPSRAISEAPLGARREQLVARAHRTGGAGRRRSRARRGQDLLGAFDGRTGDVDAGHGGHRSRGGRLRRPSTGTGRHGHGGPPRRRAVGPGPTEPPRHTRPRCSGPTTGTRPTRRWCPTCGWRCRRCRADSGRRTSWCVRGRGGRRRRRSGELLDGLRGAVLGAGHPGDGLLHEGAAEVVGSGVEHGRVPSVPSLTQLVWMLGIRPCRRIRATACTARLSRRVGPGRATPAR